MIDLALSAGCQGEVDRQAQTFQPADQLLTPEPELIFVVREQEKVVHKTQIGAAVLILRGASYRAQSRVRLNEEASVLPT